MKIVFLPLLPHVTFWGYSLPPTFGVMSFMDGPKPKFEKKITYHNGGGLHLGNMKMSSRPISRNVNLECNSCHLRCRHLYAMSDIAYANIGVSSYVRICCLVTQGNSQLTQGNTKHNVWKREEVLCFDISQFYTRRRSLWAKN